jgi:hypothetical protein
VIVLTADQLVSVFHPPEWKVVDEKYLGIVAPRPPLIARAQVFGSQIAVWVLVAKIGFNSGTARHQHPPQSLVPQLRPVATAVVAGLGAIWDDPVCVVPLLVVGNHPLLAGAGRLLDPLERHAVNLMPSRLDRHSGKHAIRTQKWRVNCVDLAWVRVDHDRVPVRIELCKVGGHLLDLSCGLSVLFAHVPV